MVKYVTKRARARRIKKGEEPTLEEMPLLEYNLKRYAYRLAERLGVAKDLIDEKWDEWVSGNLTYKEAKRIVTEEILKLAEPEKRYLAKEYINELERRQDEEVHRQLEHLIYTIRDVLEGNEYSEYFELARDMGILDKPLKYLYQELEDWKTFIVKRTYIHKYTSLVNELMDYIGKISLFLAKHPDAKVSDVVGKYEEILQMQAEAKREIKPESEEVEIELKPLVVPKYKKLIEEEEEKKEKEEIEEEVKEEEEEIEESVIKTESDAIRIAKKLELVLSAIESLPTNKQWEAIEKLRPWIEKIIKEGNVTAIPELWNAIWHYKAIALPLATAKGKYKQYAFLKKIKCPVVFQF